MGNITGSNSVNVFLGLGLPWVIATLYYSSQDPPTDYNVPAKGLTLSVVLFICCSLCAIFLLIARRIALKGELGGGRVGRILSFSFLVSLWLTYVIISSLAQYEVVSFT